MDRMDSFTREEQRRMFGSLTDFYSKHGKLPQEMIRAMAGDPECAWEIANMYATLLTEISREMIAEGQAALGRNPPAPDRERT